MTHVEAYIALKAEFEQRDAACKQAAFALDELVRRLQARVDRPVAATGAAMPEPDACEELIVAREVAWDRLQRAWDACSDDQRRSLVAPSAIRPTPPR